MNQADDNLPLLSFGTSRVADGVVYVCASGNGKYTYAFNAGTGRCVGGRRPMHGDSPCRLEISPFLCPGRCLPGLDGRIASSTPLPTAHTRKSNISTLYHLERAQFIAPFHLPSYHI